MKRFVTMIFAVCLLSLPAFAYKAYCVVASSDTGKYVTVQFGNSEDKKKLVGDDGKELKFDSYAALLDYMAKNGWQFKQLSVLDRGHYLTILEKEVNNDDEIQKGLKTE
ncbi:MAG: hypothetical protein IKO37_01845 [Prevotella sp.]|nr:hypothetical protein [Prevotella sp.]